MESQWKKKAPSVVGSVASHSLLNYTFYVMLGIQPLSLSQQREKPFSFNINTFALVSSENVANHVVLSNYHARDGLCLHLYKRFCGVTAANDVFLSVIRVKQKRKRVVI